MGDVAVQIRGMRKKSGSFVLDIERFDVFFGSVVGLVGENGAGKTTLLNIMAGRSRFDEGSLLFSDELKSARGVSVACVFDRPDIDGLLCAWDIDAVFRNLYPDWSTDEFFSYIDGYGIDRDKRIEAMSRGMKTSIGLSHGARLLLLDEVTSGIDLYSRSDMLSTIRSYALEKNATVVLSSHIVSNLELAADYCAVLSSGSFVPMDSMAAIRDASGFMSTEEYLVSLRNEGVFSRL